jgi:hypothetical protein
MIILHRSRWRLSNGVLFAIALIIILFIVNRMAGG